jgi:hypothetical protein
MNQDVHEFFETCDQCQPIVPTFGKIDYNIIWTTISKIGTWFIGPIKLVNKYSGNQYILIITNYVTKG